MGKICMMVLLLATVMFCRAQSGRDMLFAKTKKVDQSFKGKLVHLEFYKNAAGVGDTLALAVNGKQLHFYANKLGSGGEGLFYRHYFESAEYVDGYKLRLVKFKIDEVTGDSLTVTCFFDFYGTNAALAAGKSIQQQYQFSRKAVSGVMVKQENAGM